MAWTEDEYRKAGYVQKKLRLKKGSAEKLRGEAKRRGVSESALVELLLAGLTSR
jgi:hypothetical protein